MSTPNGYNAPITFEDWYIWHNGCDWIAAKIDREGNYSDSEVFRSKRAALRFAASRN